MSITTYKLSHIETYWYGTVEIDLGNPDAIEAMKQAVEFWMGWEDSLEENDGDYTKTFLKSLGKKLVLMQLHLGYNLSGIIKDMAKEEGWPLLNGSCGIRLVRCGVPEIGEDDIYIAAELMMASGKSE